MDKYEYNVKLEQIKKLIRKKDYATAARIADTIDWYKVKNNQTIVLIADVYEASGRYEQARENLKLAYDRSGLGRQIAYKLVKVCIKCGKIEEAEDFYDDFVSAAPRDISKYLLQYELAKAKGEPLEKQISILEQYLEEDMDDRWAFELAKLYHKTGQRDKCIEQCDTVMLWFSDGKYVDKAMDLKMIYTPLTKSQQQRYEARWREKSAQNNIKIEEIKVKEVDVANKYNTQNIQNALKESMDQIFAKEENPQDEAAELFKPVQKKVEKEEDYAKWKPQEKDESDDYSEADGAAEDADDYIARMALNAMTYENQRMQGMAAVADDEFEEEEEKDDLGDTKIFVTTRSKKNLGDTKVFDPRKLIIPEQVSFDAEQKPEPIEEKTEPQEAYIVEEKTIKREEEIAEEETVEEEAVEEEAVEEEVVEEEAVEEEVVEEEAVEEEEPAEEEAAVEEEEPAEEEAVEEEAVEEEAVEEEEPAEEEAVEEETVEEELPMEETAEEAAEEDTEETVVEVEPDVMEQLMEGLFSDAPLYAETVTEPKIMEEPEVNVEEVEEVEEPEIEEEPEVDVEEVEEVEESEIEEEPEVDVEEIEEVEEPEIEEEPEVDVEEIEEVEEPEIEEEPEENSDGQYSFEVDEADESEEDEEDEQIEGQMSLDDFFNAEGQYQVPEVDDKEAAITEEEPEEANEEEADEEEADEEEVDEEAVTEEETEEPDEEQEENEEIDPFETVTELKIDKTLIKHSTDFEEDLPEEEEPDEDDEMEEEEDEDGDEDSDEDSDEDGEEEKEPLSNQEIKQIIKDFIGKYSGVQGLDKQMLRTLQNVIVDDNCNIFIMGDAKSGKTSLGIDIIKVVNKIKRNNNRRIAKISADKLIGKEMEVYFDKLKGSDLFIENISLMDDDTLEELLDAIDNDRDSRIIVIEDEKVNADKLLERHGEIRDYFANRIIVKQNKIKDWVAIAQEYAEEKGYEIDEIGLLALHAKIDQLYGVTLVIQRNHVENVIDNAIKKAEKGGLFKKLFGRKKEKILTEEHFS